MNRRHPWLLTYVIAVDVAAVAVIVATFAGLPQGSWPALLAFVAFAAIADSWTVPVPPHGEVSLSFVTNFAGAILFGPCLGALITGGGSLIADAVIHRKSPAKAVFNAGQLALVSGLTGLTFQWLRSGPEFSLTGDALACIVATLVFVVANSALTSGVFAILGRNFLRIWLIPFRQGGILYLAMAPLAALVAASYTQSPWTLAYFPLLIWVVYRGFELYAKLHSETRNALVALADALERRDPYTLQHSLRVAQHVAEIGERLGLAPEELELIVSAAQIHDLGKISVDNRILFKEGPLDEEERRQVNDHPAAGAELAGKFSMYVDGATIIRHHHERWDGKGYPDGLAGEQIPLGSRIIAVADVYDAMTSDRPYRPALSHEVAVDELRRGRGTQFDALVVDAFLAHGEERLARGSRAEGSLAPADA